MGQHASEKSQMHPDVSSDRVCLCGYVTQSGCWIRRSLVVALVCLKSSRGSGLQTHVPEEQRIRKAAPNTGTLSKAWGWRQNLERSQTCFSIRAPEALESQSEHHEFNTRCLAGRKCWWADTVMPCDAFLEACDHPILLAVDSAPKELFILSMSASWLFSCDIHWIPGSDDPGHLPSPLACFSWTSWDGNVYTCAWHSCLFPGRTYQGAYELPAAWCSCVALHLEDARSFSIPFASLAFFCAKHVTRTRCEGIWRRNHIDSHWQ